MGTVRRNNKRNRGTSRTSNTSSSNNTIAVHLSSNSTMKDIPLPNNNSNKRISSSSSSNNNNSNSNRIINNFNRSSISSPREIDMRRSSRLTSRVVLIRLSSSVGNIRYISRTTDVVSYLRHLTVYIYISKTKLKICAVVRRR